MRVKRQSDVSPCTAARREEGTAARRLRVPLVLGLIAAAVFAGAASGYPDGPPNRRTWCGNAGAEPVCGGGNCSNCTVSCHNSFGGPNTGGGSVSIQNLPASGYRAGVSYTLAVLLEDPGNADFNIGGFELSVLQGTDRCQAGDLIPDEPNTRVDLDGGTGTQWLKHSAPQNQAAGTAMWQLLWTAPDPPVGDVVFNVCANAANNADGNQGDYIYCTEAVVAEETAPVEDPVLKVAHVAADRLDLAWTGAADGFNLYKGPLSEVAAVVTSTGAYQQLECGVGANATQDPAPGLGGGTDLFYLVVPVQAGQEITYGCMDPDGDGICDMERTVSVAACP